MKSSELKKLIKESVKEAIQEELKEILLEAVKTPKVTTIASPPQQPVVEQHVPQQPVMSAEEKRAAYSNILGDMSGQFTTAQVQPKFNPKGGDSINGSLPPGEVDMSQIAGLLKK
tara:strand:- start:1367 stop:1711 length:345 start_codon:yes stop_codon:yes gene_type:complete